MPNSPDFLAYVGDPEIHDARIVSIHISGDKADVTLQSHTGSSIQITFHDVESIKQKDAEGLLLYALAEFKAIAPLRRFSFLNWEDEDPAFLEVVAREIQVVKIAPDKA